MPGIRRTSTTPQPVGQELSAIRRYASANVDRFIQSQFKVVDKRGITVDFIYNWPQQQLAKAITDMEAEGLPVRIFALKSRQVGTSTQCLARNTCKTWANDNLEAVVIAQQELRAQELLARCKFFYSSLAKSLQLPLSQDSKMGLKYADTRGAITIISAKNYLVARGGTKQLFQLSEFAYYPNPILVLNEMEQLVTYETGTEIVLETTGKGYGSDAHEFYKLCKQGRENYRVVFLPWQDDPKCCVHFPNERSRDAAVHEAIEYEPRLEDWMKHHRLSAGNIVYAYRLLKGKIHGGDWEFFLQEYPCDDEEAWRAHGESYFGSENLNAIHPADFQCEYYVFGVNAPLGQCFESFEDLEKVERLDENANRPFIKVWKRPHPHGFYVISGDSAEGLEDGNFSSTFVIDQFTCEMMAEFHGKLRPDEHAYVMASLGFIYNSGMCAPEYNRPGNVTLNELHQRILYPNIYRWRYVDDYKFTPSRKLGWETNTKSRALMLSLAKRIVEDLAKGRVLNKGVLKSVALLQEMRTFVIDPETGKPEAQVGAQDDRVMAWAIALQVAAQETVGGDGDILGLYKKTEQKQVSGLDPDAAKYDPMDVVDRLMGKE